MNTVSLIRQDVIMTWLIRINPDSVSPWQGRRLPTPLRSNRGLGPEHGAALGFAFQRYRDYLNTHAARFPRGALALALSGWYFDPSDHRCPHDAWLEGITISEPAVGSAASSAALPFGFGCWARITMGSSNFLTQACFDTP